MLKTSENRKKNRNTTQNGRSLPQTGTAEDRISELDEMEIKGKTEEILDNSRSVKGICNNSLNPSKGQT
jgi:hypothetical protein